MRPIFNYFKMLTGNAILVNILILVVFTSKRSYAGSKQLSHSTNKVAELDHRLSKSNKVSFSDIIKRNETFNTTSQDILVFLHVQKTGGTTFERHLVYDLRIDQPCSCSELKRRCLCLRRPLNGRLASIAEDTWLISRFSTGWVCGLHPDWSQLDECLRNLRNLYFITFLRNPLHRFVSEFRHVQRGATWKASKSHCGMNDTHFCYRDKPNWFNVSLDEFLNCPSNMAINRQTRMLADHDQLKCSEDGDTSVVDRAMLSSAMDNLKDMAYFGLCGEQKISQIMFEKTFKLTFREEFQQSDDNKTRILIDNMPKEARNRILELNHLDVKLYEFALGLFSQRCKQLNIDCGSINSMIEQG